MQSLAAAFVDELRAPSQNLLGGSEPGFGPASTSSVPAPQSG
ncbi:MAG: hypothetical protein ACREU6_00840 [Steroidobacteraceae bacterium]